MSDKLKTFVNKNKEEFETEIPPRDLWNRIDSKLEAKRPSFISSKLLSRLKYFGLSASLLVIGVYFISKSLDNTASSELAQHRKDSAANSSEQWVKANQNKSEITNAGKNIPDHREPKPGDFSKNLQTSPGGNGNETDNMNSDSITGIPEENSISETNKVKLESHASLKDEENTNIPNESNTKTNKSKRIKISVPDEPEKANYYSATLYDNSSLCEVVQIYKFPGKVNLDGSSNYTDRRTLKTISCSRLENTSAMKAVWIKGKTTKKVTLSIKEGFKNIVLVKSDGRELSPEAISHYYPGLGVISSYTGKYFDMIFKDKVDLILFFKDAEPGDKVMINGIIEAVIKN